MTLTKSSQRSKGASARQHGHAGPKRPRSGVRLDRETWLLRALEALADEGPQVLAVETLCARLGVTRGSFYWHFKTRSAFVEELVADWDKRFTQAICDEIAVQQGDAAERLLALMALIDQAGATRFDIPVRAWAAAEPSALAAVKRTDQARYRFVRSLFAELGFSGDELEMRTRTFVVYFSLQNAISVDESKKTKDRRNQLRHRLLTNPEPS